jgi:uncharacterized protein (TIGR02996 family)
MASDLEALLAAVVANPADDVARLVYADCLEENGNAPRARFIRLQIEAERYHPNSRAHAERTAEAAALFATHWPDWWAEVCAATGLRPAARAPKSALGRLARWVGRGPRPGAPYLRPQYHPFAVSCDWSEPNAHFAQAVFERGFPERLSQEFDSAPVVDETLAARWARAVPLVTLASNFRCLGPPGPYLSRLRELMLSTPFTMHLDEWFASPFLEQLEALSFIGLADYEPEWLGFLARPVMSQLKRLHTGLACRALGEALARAGTLTAVRELSLSVEGPGGEGLAALRGSPLAARVECLKLSGPVRDPDVRTLADWPHLRALRLWLEGDERNAQMHGPQLVTVRTLSQVPLPSLEDLHLSFGFLTDGTIDELVRLPVTKQLRHVALSVAHVNDASGAALRRLPEAFDPARIETIFVRTNAPRPELAELTRAFGDRVRLVTL